MTPAAGYTEMKDSGIEWIGEIPAHWTTIANKYVMRKKKRICEKWENQNVLSLTMNGVVVRDILNPVGKMPTTFDGYQFADSGELLMCLFDIDVTPRCVGRVFCDGVTSPAYSCFQLNNHADLGYYYYYYLMVDNTKELLHLAKNLRHSFTEEQLGMLKVPFPPFEEQTAIASYLDTQCAKIDEIIAEAKASIEDYKQWKASIIYEAVTKGLDPDVEMKDSGVEWIGQMPSTWGLKKAKNCVLITNGSDPKTEGNIPVYGSGAESFKTCGEYKNGPAVLIGRKGATLHIPHYISGRYWNVDTAFDVKAKEGFSLKYYYYLACSFDYKYYISQTTLPSMTQTNYNNICLPFPPAIVQEEICRFLDNSISKIDELITEKQSLISDLESYKQSIIYEVVTGKRRVC